MRACRGAVRILWTEDTMDISRAEQRILHLLAQGGHIDVIRRQKKLAELHCYSREG